jgi:hypothetical protein
MGDTGDGVQDITFRLRRSSFPYERGIADYVYFYTRQRVVRSLSISMRLKQCATPAPVCRGDKVGGRLSCPAWRDSG